ncbi:MAG TPA: hypothetical protein VF838_19405 [Trebonia sp.]
MTAASPRWRSARWIPPTWWAPGSRVIADGITSLEAAHLPAPDGFPELPGGTFRVDTIPAICAGPSGIACVAWADYR